METDLIKTPATTFGKYFSFYLLCNDHNILLQVQHNAQNQGRCGVCGEEYSNPNKKFEPGRANKFATGTIVGEFNQGETSKFE